MNKLNFQWPLFITVAIAFGFASCDKSNGTFVPTSGNGQSAVDYTIISNAISALADDASLSADQTSGIARSTGQLTGICGSTNNDTMNGQDISITYDSTTFCQGVIRSGTITVALSTGSTGWRMPGGSITVTLYNVKITDPETTEQFILNGTFNVINESGGFLASSNNNSSPVTRRHQSLNSLQVTLNGTTTNWSFDRTRAWTALNISADTLMNIAQYTEAPTGIECTGVNRYGQTFTTTIDTALQTSTYKCPSAMSTLMEPYIGVISQTVNGIIATISYGTTGGGQHTGTPQSCPSGGNYGYHITYIDTGSNLISYLFWPYYL